jgi:hypothetical protein
VVEVSAVMLVVVVHLTLLLVLLILVEVAEEDHLQLVEIKTLVQQVVQELLLLDTQYKGE